MNKRNSKIFARQGDIGILFADGRKTDGLKRVPPDAAGRLTLGHGAATGQRHTVSASDVDLYEDGQNLLMVVHRETRLDHVEHDREKLPEKVLIPGTFTVVRQEEKLQEEVRRVED